MKHLFIIVALFNILCGQVSADNRFPNVPDTVVDHSPASSGIYVGSPNIALLSNGDFIVSHDEFGGKSSEHVRAVSHIFRSKDRWRTWHKIATIKAAFWSTLFLHRNALYLLGTDRHHGNPVIRRQMTAARHGLRPPIAAPDCCAAIMNTIVGQCQSSSTTRDCGALSSGAILPEHGRPITGRA